jgi:hypothetical protein
MFTKLEIFKHYFIKILRTQNVLRKVNYAMTIADFSLSQKLSSIFVKKTEINFRENAKTIIFVSILGK